MTETGVIAHDIHFWRNLNIPAGNEYPIARLQVQSGKDLVVHRTRPVS